MQFMVVKKKLLFRVAVLTILFCLIILLIYYSNGLNKIFHTYKVSGSPLPSSLKEWGVTDSLMPISGEKNLDRHCNRCVIVTSSGHLLGSKLGAEIDRSECTIRMNDAPTMGYEADVGNKTTFRVVGHSSIFFILNKTEEFVNELPQTIFIFWGPRSKKKEMYLKMFIKWTRMTFPNVAAFAMTSQRMFQFDYLFWRETGKNRETSRSWLSTGWFTMAIAVELCDQVHVYGMIPPNYCMQKPIPRNVLYHYYDPEGPNECATFVENESGHNGYNHRFISEKWVFAKWSKLYNITFSNPNWV